MRRALEDVGALSGFGTCRIQRAEGPAFTSSFELDVHVAIAASSPAATMTVTETIKEAVGLGHGSGSATRKSTNGVATDYERTF